MRTLAVLLACSLALTGCLSDTDDESASNSGTASGVDDACKFADRKGVVLETGTYQALPEQPHTVEVDVPECAVNVSVDISTAGTANPNQADVELTGCGSVSISFGGAGNVQVGVENQQSADLCLEAEAGMQTFTIESPMLPLSGTVTLRADLPS